MTSATSHDGDLVSAYAREGSETAFHALVARHVDLVFATAMRQTGDRGLAEEITQNVVVALARKAPRLAGFATLAGWLHQAAVRESKTISAVRHPDGSFNISIQSGTMSMSTGGDRTLGNHIPPHLLPFFSTLEGNAVDSGQPAP